MSGCIVPGGAVDRQTSVANICHMSFQPAEQFNIADYFLDARVREGKGARPAVLADSGTLTDPDLQTPRTAPGVRARRAPVWNATAVSRCVTATRARVCP